MSDTPASRLGHPPDFVTRPSAPPIYQTTAFDIRDLNVLQQVCDGDATGHIYSRESNPNHTALADSIAQLERAEAGAVFASGMGALAAIVMTLAGSGDHAIVSRGLYGKTLQLFDRLDEQFRLDVTLVDACNVKSVASAIQRNTKLCLVETVSNPLLEVADVGELAAVLGTVPLIVDSTFTTSELIQPVTMGAAAVIHSASKYLNGHGDVMSGVAAGTRELMTAATQTASVFGQNANPFESWLTQRGLRTLSLRMQQVCRSTRELADWLCERPQLRRVHYPLLPDHPSFEPATRLYPGGTGGIISVELDGGGREAVSRLMNALPQLPFSPTLADARTTLSHPASTSHRHMSQDQRATIGICDEMIRISVGLEPVELLKEEITAGLEALTS